MMNAIRLILLAGLLAVSGRAQDSDAATKLGDVLPTVVLSDGTILHNVKIVSFGNVAVMAKWDGGRGTIPYDALPPEIRQAVEPKKAAAAPQAAAPPASASDSALVAARRGFSTKLLRRESSGYVPDQPPPEVLTLVSYAGPLGQMAAFVSPPSHDGKRHPAIIWLTGGFSNSISAIAWVPAMPENDQSARGFRDAGILMMYPSLRGGNTSPGFHEGFLGEVNDVIAAARYLAKLPYVDPERIYLGGHSTGGTLALLVAESTNQFRAVYALGPVGNVAVYGSALLPYDMSNRKESLLRSPQPWLDSIRVPTFVFEGTVAPSNIADLKAMSEASHNPAVKFQVVPGGTHFSIIRPVVHEIAQQILQDQQR